MRRAIFSLAAAGCFMLTSHACAAPSARAMEQLGSKGTQPAILPINVALPLRYTVDYAAGCAGTSGETVITALNRSLYPNKIHIKFFDLFGNLVAETSTVTMASNDNWVFATADPLASPLFSYVDLIPGYATDPCLSFVGYAQIYTQRMPIQITAWTLADGQVMGVPIQVKKLATGNH